MRRRSWQSLHKDVGLVEVCVWGGRTVTDEYLVDSAGPCWWMRMLQGLTELRERNCRNELIRS